MGSISVHEGPSYDPNGPNAELDKKVTVTTDTETEEMSDEERAETRRGVDPEALQKAQEDFNEGKGDQHLDLRSKEQQEASEEAEDQTDSTTDEEKGDQSSPGNSSQTSSAKDEKSSSTTPSAPPSTAHSAGGLSNSGRTGSGTAGSTGGRKGSRN